MQIIENISELENACIAFGSFDGVHKGHLEILRTVVKEAADRGLTPAAVSLAGDSEVLTTEQEKAYYFEKAGIEIMVSVSPERAADISLEDIMDSGRIKALVIGEAAKCAELVKELAGMDIEVIVCDMVSDGGKNITSEMVKEAFYETDFERLEKLCGHPYIMMGEVVHGKALGRTVGMPTANLGVPDFKLKPPNGVYATLGHVVGKTYKSLTNIGKRPSVDDMDHITIEVFLLDFAQSIYGEKMTIEVHKFIRGVQKFGNLEEVQLQVKKDLEKVRTFLDTLRNRKHGCAA